MLKSLKRVSFIFLNLLIMKKLLLSIGCVAMLGMGFLAVSCKEDDDYADGKKAGKAFCDCMKGTDPEDCNNVSLSKLTNMDWMKGYSEALEACNSED
jgi:hypothetical protein